MHTRLNTNNSRLSGNKKTNHWSARKKLDLKDRKFVYNFLFIPFI